jgi:hypothetical protein
VLEIIGTNRKDLILLAGSRLAVILLFPIMAAGMGRSFSPDLRLITLVPSDARMVAGVGAPTLRGQQPSTFLLITPNNTADLNDFLALSGVDDERVIHQVILVATKQGTRNPDEHSVLASGRFNEARIFKAAVENGAAMGQYKSVRIVVLSPFQRERQNLHDIRWLAIVGENVAILGTIENVRAELDRHLNKTPADLPLMQSLAQLNGDDMSWCLVRTLVQNDLILHALGSLDPEFARRVHDGDTILFGIHYGRRIRFEYVLTTSDTSAQAGSPSLVPSSGTPNPTAYPLMAAVSQVNGSIRGKVYLSTTRYEKWLAEVSGGAPDHR